MKYQNLIISTGDDHVAQVVLNRPEQLNTFTSDMARELHQALQTLDAEEQVRVILLKGAGKAFCAGIDINEIFDKSNLAYRRWIERMERPLVAIGRMATPVIAVVQGVAAANGTGLVASADLAIAAANARFGLTAVNVGLNCVGPVIPVRRSVGRKRALEMLLFGNLIKAPQALEMGLINQVVPADELEEKALQWAKDLARRSPVAVQMAKQAFYASDDMTYDQQFDYMNEIFARLCSTEDAKEGVRAFLEKRVPQWKLR